MQLKSCWLSHSVVHIYQEESQQCKKQTEDNECLVFLTPSIYMQSLSRSQKPKRDTHSETSTRFDQVVR